MTLLEFSDRFNLFWNNIDSNQAPGLNEWEKSVFLTQAQNQLVKEYFNNRVDAVGGGFDGSQKRQYDFSSIIRTEELREIPSTMSFSTDYHTLIDKRSKLFLFPEQYFLIVNEILSDERYQYSVLPIDYEEYQRLMLKPYSYPIKRGAWRLIAGKINFLRKVKVVVEETEPDTFNAYEHYTTKNGDILPYSVDVSFEETPDGIVELHTVTVISSTEVDEDDIIVTYTTRSSKAFKKGKYSTSVDDVVTTSTTPNVDVTTSPSNNTPSTPTDTIPKDGGINNQTPSSAQLEDYETVTVPLVEIIGKFKGEVSYKVRYVKNLKPIILDDLTNYGEDLSIEGITDATPCELPEECHEEIVERAVTLAKIAWQGGTLTQARQSSKED